MHFVFCAFGTVGDVKPLLKIGQSLVEMGHDVTFVINPAMVQLMIDVNMSYVSVGDHWVLDVNDTRLLNPRYVWKDVYRHQVELMSQAIQKIHSRKSVDGVVNHIWCFGGAFGAELIDCPWATIALSPITWMSASNPPQLDHRTLSPTLHRWVIKRLVQPMFRFIFESDLQKQASKLGLPNQPDRFLRMYQQAQLNVGLWSRHWRDVAEDDPPRTIFAGFPKEEGNRLPPTLRSWLATGPPPIVMGLGSALPKMASKEYAMVAAACLKRNQRLICVGIEPTALAHLKIDSTLLYIEKWISYKALFPHACAVIHHGGIGSTAEALYAGVPTLVIAFGNDQNDNGFRNTIHNVGCWVPRQKLNTKILDAKLDEILGNQTMIERAKNLSEKLLSEPPGQQVCAQSIVEAFS